MWFTSWQSRGDCLRALRPALVSLSAHVSRVLDTKYTPETEVFARASIVACFKCLTFVFAHAKEFTVQLTNGEPNAVEVQATMAVSFQFEYFILK